RVAVLSGLDRPQPRKLLHPHRGVLGRKCTAVMLKFGCARWQIRKRSRPANRDDAGSDDAGSTLAGMATVEKDLEFFATPSTVEVVARVEHHTHATSHERIA